MTDFIDDLYALTNFKKGKYTLDNMLLLTRELDLVDLPYKVIHVAGTNGKGSVCHKIATTLGQSGYKTGLFSSPHIASFQERIRVDGKMITEKEAETSIRLILGTYKRKNLTPTFFEILTLLAMLFFKKRGVEFAVFEVGLGGRLDATNVLSSVLSIITSISLDHAHILGDSLEKIAEEKGGIIKSLTPVVLGPRAQLSPIVRIAEKKEAPVIRVKGSFVFYDTENREIAQRALIYLKKAFGLQYVDLEGPLSSRPSCRFEIVDHLIFDVAHNCDGIIGLIAALKKWFPKKSYRFLIGLSSDKALFDLVKAVGRVSSHTHLISTGERLYSVDELKKTFLESGFPECSYEKSLQETVQKARNLSLKKGEILVVTGSFFIMQEVKKNLGLTLEENPKEDKVFLNEKLNF